MKIRSVLLMLLVMFVTVPYAWAGEGDQGSMMEQQMKAEKSSAVEVGNKTCPVSGEEIGEMGPGVQVEYKGKIYNLCCSGCVADFNKDPEKYVKIVEEQMGNQKMMGEKDAPMMMKDEGMGASMMGQEEMMKPAAEVKEVNLEAYQFGFSPETIVVNKGDTVIIHATSRDVTHGVAIKEYGINEKVEQGKVTDIKFVADKAGTFEIHCSVYCGAGHAQMRAELIVNP